MVGFSINSMRDYTAEKYIKLVENMDDNILQSDMGEEKKIITNVQNSKNKTFVDIGAGYGRLLPLLSNIARNVISIEINPGMSNELMERTKKYDNARSIKGDIQGLSRLLVNEDIKNPV